MFKTFSRLLVITIFFDTKCQFFCLGNIFTPLDKPSFKSLNVELRFVPFSRNYTSL